MSESRQQPASDNPPSGKGLWAKAQSIDLKINRPGGVQHVTPETFLSDYLVDVFLSEKQLTPNGKYTQEFHRAVKWLHIARAKRPRLRDLTLRKLHMTAEFMYALGYSRKWADKMLHRLCNLWRHAHEAGILEEYVRVHAPEPEEPMYPFMDSPPPENTLQGFYVEHVRAFVGHHRRANSDPATRNLDIMCGRYVRIDEVSEHLLEVFRDWLLRQDKSDARIESYLGAIRFIVRAFDKKQLPKHYEMLKLPPLPAAEPGTFRYFYETVHRPQRMLDVTPVYHEQVDRSFRYLREHFDGDIRLDEVNDGKFAEHFAWLRDVKKLANGGINTHRGPLFAVWRHAFELREVPEPPRLRAMRADREEPDSWGPAELAKLLQATDVMGDHERWTGPVPLGAWWRAFLLTAWWTGLRAGSLRTILLQDVDVSKRTIYVRAKNMKNRRGKRFKIGEDAAQAIAGIMEPERELLFPFPCHRESLWRQFKKIQKAAGLKHNGRGMSRLHKIRRSVATQAVVHAGMAAAVSLLGHSGPEVTKRYLDPSRMPGTDATEFLPTLELGEK